LMVEEGMSEVQAKNDAISRMDYASTVTPARPASKSNWFADEEITSDPVFTGNFKERGWANPPAKGSTNQPTGGETVSPPPSDAATQSPTDAPTDPTARVVGRVYKSPTGALGRWTATGWEIVNG
jgi:hypothetical protein